MKPWIGYVLAAGGVAAAGTGAFLLWRQQRGLGFVREADAIDQYSAGGMVTTHRRSRGMPIEQRIRSIQNLVYKSVHDPRMRKLALEATRACPERNGKCEAEAVYTFTKNRVRYTGDVAPIKMGADGPVEGIDLYQSAFRTLEFGGGDCDDQAILNATLLSLNGIPAKLRVTAPTKFGDWSHIYVVAGLPKLSPTQWIPIDTTLPGRNKFGYEVPFGRHNDYPA